ncbi:hypothetical protein V6N11_009503 [Hibiscus sabdariffa]|uniref:Large ribosomal subunit protein uL6 alpha-beta domain-containing protein n=1 Tax=Hibiscus sabdariffa TaxID=183260 RepID=A0ABR2P6C9_9ROSI
MEAKFFRFLKIVGVGYKARAEAEGRLLFLKLGYSHEVELTVPPAVRVFCFKNNVVCCTGLDKQRVHQFAATVRSCKPPEVYKGKGIMYIDEVIKKKQGLPPRMGENERLCLSNARPIFGYGCGG